MAGRRNRIGIISVGFASALAACQPTGWPQPQRNGPASLDLVPADYYSRVTDRPMQPRPGPMLGKTRAREADAEQGSDDPPPVMLPPNLDQRLKALQGRVDQLREELSKRQPAGVITE